MLCCTCVDCCYEKSSMMLEKAVKVVVLVLSKLKIHILIKNCFISNHFLITLFCTPKKKNYKFFRAELFNDLIFAVNSSTESF